MADKDFFEEKEEKPVEEKPEEESVKVKVGEKEYTQDELSRLVGLGETATEFEGKWNRKIDQLYPDYTQKSQKLSELEKQREEEAKSRVKEKEESGEQLSPEELRARAVEEADKLGLIHQGNVNKFISDFMQARDLLDDVEAVIAQAEEDGTPKATAQELLAYMDETGIKSPQYAYRIKFENELEELKSKKVKDIKPKGMETLTTSNAGSKEPETQKPANWDSLTDAMRSYLQNRSQAA